MGVHHPEPKCHLDLKSNFFSTFWKIYIPNIFLILGKEGGNIAQKQHYTLTQNPAFSVQGGGDIITQVKFTFGKMYLPKFFLILGGGRYIAQNQNITLTQNPTVSFLGGGVHRPSQIYLWQNLPSEKNVPILRGAGVHCKSVRFMESDCLSTAATSRQLC